MAQKYVCQIDPIYLTMTVENSWQEEKDFDYDKNRVKIKWITFSF